jgi:Ser/Thr protein kinase RdoA (MazF antagonist)
MSNVVVQVFKNINTPKAASIHFPEDFPQKDMLNPTLMNAAKGLFMTDGVLLLRNLFPREFIAHLYQSFIHRYHCYFEEQLYANALEVGDKRRMLTLDIEDPFNDPNLYGNPFLLSLMHEVLGKGFVLGSFGAVISLPGSEHQHIHRDHPPLFNQEELDSQIPSFAITVVIPLIDLTQETGSTRVWKGSHRLYRSQKLDFQESFVPLVPIGSCYLMDYQLLHGGTPNTSNIVRPILYLNYYRSWFQESVNYEKQVRISITQQEYQKIPDSHKFLFERIREVIGFSKISHATLNPHQLDKPFCDLSLSEQAQRLKILAQQCLINYGLKQPQLDLISHGDNTIFSVNVSDTTEEINHTNLLNPHQFALRIYRSNYLTIPEVESELIWLKSLRDEAQLPIPTPILNREGKLYTLAQVSEVPEQRVCCLSEWIHGRSLLHKVNQGKFTFREIESVGQLLAKLHHHANQWTLPEHFARPTWNWDGLFGDGAGYSNKNGKAVWEQTPQPYSDLFLEISREVKSVMASLGESREQFGLIHGDFWLGNLLLFEQKIYPIDFADCGFGYWGYDVARFLGDFITAQNFSMCSDSLLSGYTKIRNFPEEQFPYIPIFMIAQQVTLGLWRVNRAQDHPSFRSTLEHDLQKIASHIEFLFAKI